MNSTAHTQAVGFPDQRRTLQVASAWIVVAPFLAFAAVFILTVIDPFEFESVTKRQSANIFYKLYATQYPTRHRDSISVVLLDDEAVNTRFETWPPSHLLHGDILAAIHSYNPLAVLVDIYFIRGREGDHFDRMRAVIDEYNVPEKRVPLFMVAAGPSTRALQAAREEILWLAYNDKKIRLVSAEIESEAGESAQYPATSSSLKPAAVAIYETICKELKDSERPRGTTCATLDQHALEKFEVVWGLAPAQFNCRRASTTEYHDVCRELNPSLAGRAMQLTLEAAVPRNRRRTDPMPLPYHPTIAANDILDGSKRAMLAPLLTGKVVVYGAHLALVKDEVFSPVHGSIEGAYVHAMALDNLLTFGDQLVHRGAGHQTWRKEWTEFQPTALMLFVAVAVGLNRWRILRKYPPNEWHHRAKEDDDRFLRLMWWFLVITVMVAGLVEFAVWGISPFNWLALIIVVHIAHRIEKWFFKPEAWAKSLNAPAIRA